MKRWLLLVSMSALPAAANMGATVLHPGVVSIRPVAEQVRTEVLSEKLTFDCSARPCRFEAAYAIRNPGPDAEALAIEFLGVRTSEVELELDGKPLPSRKSEPTRALAEELARTLDALSFSVWRDLDRLDRVEATVEIAPSRELALVARGLVSPEETFSMRDYLIMPGVAARHPAWTSPRTQDELVLEYPLGPIRTWAGDPRIAVTVRVPESWTVDGGVFNESGRAAGCAWRIQRQGGISEARCDVRATSQRDRLDVVLGHERGPLFPGGFQLALGASLADRERFLVRAGYQAALPLPILHTVSLDYDFSALRASYVFEYATPEIVFIIPTLAFGAGPIAELLPSRAFGVRMIAETHFFIFGFALTYDQLFSPLPARSQLTLAGQLSF